MTQFRYTTFHYFFAMDLWNGNDEELEECIKELKERYNVDNLNDSCVKEVYNGNVAWNNKNEECVKCIR